MKVYHQELQYCNTILTTVTFECVFALFRRNYSYGRTVIGIWNQTGARLSLGRPAFEEARQGGAPQIAISAAPGEDSQRSNPSRMGLGLLGWNHDQILYSLTCMISWMSSFSHYTQS